MAVKQLRWLVAGVVSGLVVSMAHAAAVEPDPRRAELLAGMCFSCHGTDGRHGGDFEPLAGRSFEALQDTLLAFRADSVPGATVMPRLVKGLDEAEIRALARYFSSLEANSAEVSR